VIDGKCGGGSGGTRSDDGEFRMTVSTACDPVIFVSARGYKGWVYTDPSDPSHPTLRINSGEQKRFDIELEPLPSPSQRGAGESQGVSLNEPLRSR